MSIKTVLHPPYSPDVGPCDFWLFPKLRGCRYETIEMKKAVTKVIDTLTQEDFDGAFQKLLERYKKCIAAGGDYFEGDLSFMCVLSIKMPIRKKVWKLIVCTSCIFNIYMYKPDSELNRIQGLIYNKTQQTNHFHLRALVKLCSIRYLFSWLATLWVDRSGLLKEDETSILWRTSNEQDFWNRRPSQRRVLEVVVHVCTVVANDL